LPLLLPASALAHGLDPVLLGRTAPEGSSQPDAEGKVGCFALLIRGHLEPPELIARPGMRAGYDEGKNNALRALLALYCHNQAPFLGAVHHPEKGLKIGAYDRTPRYPSRRSGRSATNI
jgi:hypothetical protein